MLIHVNTAKPTSKPLTTAGRKLSKALVSLASQLADCLEMQFTQETLPEIKQNKALISLAIKQISDLQGELKALYSFRLRNLETLSDTELAEFNQQIAKHKYAIKQTASQIEALQSDLVIERISELGATGKLVFKLTCKQLTCRHELNGISIVIFQRSR